MVLSSIDADCGWTIVITLSTAVLFYLLGRRSNRWQSDLQSSAPFRLSSYWRRRLIESRIKRPQRFTLESLKREDLEKSRPLESENSFDSQFIYGQDSSGNSLTVKLTRRRNRSAVVWLVLRLQDGRLFTLPDHPDTVIPDALHENNFDAAGLLVECLVPNVRWRVKFNGVLRRGSRKEWSSDIGETELVAVKFHFLWTTKSDPMYWPVEWNASLMSSVLLGAKENPDEVFDKLSHSDSWGWDQFGSMRGEIFIGHDQTDAEQFEVNLPGFKQRRWGSNETKNLNQICQLIGVCRDGTVFNVGAFDSGNGSANCQFGNVIFSNTNWATIDWTDFDLTKMVGHQFKSGTYSIRFRAQNKEFTVLLRLKPGTVIPLVSGEPNNWRFDSCCFEFTLNGADGYGLALLGAPASDRLVIPKPILVQRVAYSSHRPTASKLVYHFDDPEARSVQISGGKGASLALLTSITKRSDLDCPVFYVPAGFVLSVSAMDLMVNRNRDVHESIESLVGLCSEGANFDEHCKLLVDGFRGLTLANTIVQDVLVALQFLKAGHVQEIRFAVRSSSVCEDGEDVSAAGQNETFLGLKSDEDVLEAIKVCWASLYTFQSVQYRKQNIQPIRTGMAVVVQTMLPADVAGVLFSQHPLTGEPRKCLISANFGLGESVVSGEVDPDNYVVKRSYRDTEFTIVSRSIGKKSHKIEMGAENSVQKVAIEGMEACLKDGDIVALARIGVVLEKLYGSGRDIEWGMKDGKYYLLQARPITSLHQLTDWELSHELDSAVMGDDEFRTNALAAEVFPGALTPLTISVLIQTLDRLVVNRFAKQETNHVTERVMLQCTNHTSMDLFSMFFRSPSKEETVFQQILSYAFAGHQFITPEINQISLNRISPNKWNRIVELFDMGKDLWDSQAKSRLGKEMTMSFKNKYSAENMGHFRRAKDLLDNIDESMKVVRQIIEVHNTTSMVSTACQLIMMVVISEGAKKLTNAHFADMRLILGSSKDTESADVPKKLEEMAKGIVLAGKQQEFCEVESEAGMAWLETNIPAIGALFKTFIEKNAHRALKEYELATITWGMRPGIIIEMLQATVRYSEDVSSLTKTNTIVDLEPEQLVQQLKSPQKWITKWMLAKLVRYSQRSVQQRELSKSNFIAVIHELRKAFRHLGTLMTRKGCLSHSDLVFYLSVTELRTLIVHKNVDLMKKALRRQRLYPQLNRLRYPEIMQGVPQPIKMKKPSDISTGNEIRGTSVYSGVVTGRACVIHEFAEVSKIQPGDILITHSTDIGWTPYFPVLGGVVTELGGLISHGAVVAREYGLPCVVAAEDASHFFTFGETVTLDATNGVLYRGEEK